MSAVKVAISMDDGTLAVMEFLVTGRSPTPPSGAVWIAASAELWRREPNDENIAAEIVKSMPAFNTYGDPQPQPVWWFIVDAKQIPTDRTYRNAWVGTNGKDGITHDMPKAREYHRTLLRHDRQRKLMELDGKWHRATGQGKKAEADAVESERQKWRDAPADPRIEAAQSVEELKQIRVE